VFCKFDSHWRSLFSTFSSHAIHITKAWKTKYTTTHYTTHVATQTQPHIQFFNDIVSLKRQGIITHRTTTTTKQQHNQQTINSRLQGAFCKLLCICLVQLQSLKISHGRKKKKKAVSQQFCLVEPWASRGSDSVRQPEKTEFVLFVVVCVCVCLRLLLLCCCGCWLLVVADLLRKFGTPVGPHRGWRPNRPEDICSRRRDSFTRKERARETTSKTKKIIELLRREVIPPGFFLLSRCLFPLSTLWTSR